MTEAKASTMLHSPGEFATMRAVPQPDWITTAEAVEISGYHIRHLRRLLRADKIRSQKWGREWMVSRRSLLGYIRGIAGSRRGPKPTA